MRTIISLVIVLPIILCGINAILNRRAGSHPHKTPFTAILYTNCIFLPLCVILQSEWFGTTKFSMLCGLVLLTIYVNCIGFLNWFIFTLTDVSMHIQLMMQIHSQGSISTEQLVERYNKNTILKNRIPRLLELRQLRLEGGRLFLRGHSVLFGARVCRMLRRVLGIPERPEDADHFE